MTFKKTAMVLGATLLLFSFSSTPDDHVEFVCLKKKMSTKTCHYNFKVDGARYRYVDIGCRFKKLDQVIEKVKDGDLALAREWEIQCAGSQPEGDGQE